MHNYIIITKRQSSRTQLFSDDGLKSFSTQKSGDKKFPEQLGISAGKDLLKQSEGQFKKKR